MIAFYLLFPRTNIASTKMGSARTSQNSTKHRNLWKCDRTSQIMLCTVNFRLKEVFGNSKNLA